MSLWDSIAYQFANFGASTGQFVLDWWPLLVLLAVMIIIVGLVCSGWKHAPLDPSVEYPPKPMFPGWYNVLDEAEMVLEQCVHFYEVEHAEKEDEA